MARPLLLAGGWLWAIAGAAGLSLAALGSEPVSRLLPPLGIGEAALERTVAALAVGCLLVAAGHAVVVTGLERRRRWAASAGILLAALLGMTFLATAAALVTSAAAATIDVRLGGVAGAASLAIAAAYGLVAATLVGALRGHGRAS